MGRDVDRWRQDAELLAAIGRELFTSDTRVTVRLSLDVARFAVAAWQRNDLDDDHDDETAEERIVRHRAAALALIGLAIDERGQWFEDHVQVALDAWDIGTALDCADDYGQIQDPSGPGR